MKNNKKFENFIRDFENIKMTQSEKNKMRHNLDLFVDSYSPQPSPYSPYISYGKKVLVLSLIMLLTITLTRPVAANSLPGEILYPVKIIHEKIESATIKKPEEKINFEIKRTQKRIQEAVTLAKKKKLNTEKQKEIAEGIKKQVNETATQIQKIKKENPEKALSLNSDLKTALKVNSKALKEVSKQKEAQEQKDNLVKKEVQTAISEINEIDIHEEIEVSNPEQEAEKESVEQKESKKNENPADTLLDSIDQSIEKTEQVEENLEEEISEKRDGEEDTTEEKPEVDAENVKDIDSLVDTEKEEDENKETKQKPDVGSKNEDSSQAKANSENEKELRNKNIAKKQEFSEQNKGDAKYQSEVEDKKLEKKIKSEITSLEQVLATKEKLNKLLDELDQKRSKENIKTVKELLENKKFGKAIVILQKEIENLNETKLSKDLETKLGIKIPEEKKEVDNKNQEKEDSKEKTITEKEKEDSEMETNNDSKKEVGANKKQDE